MNLWVKFISLITYCFIQVYKLKCESTKKDIRGTLTKVEEYNKDRPQINVIENKQNPKLLIESINENLVLLKS